MALVEGIKLDLGNVWEGFSGLITSIREAITGEPSPEKKAKAEAAVMQMEFLLNQGQQKIQEVEAAHPSIFVAGARPFIVWVCGVTLAAYYIPVSVMAGIIWVMACIQAGWKMVPFQSPFDMGQIIALVFSLLGLGGLRTVEKIKGVQGHH
jgi:hypothetical protein